MISVKVSSAGPLVLLAFMLVGCGHQLMAQSVSFSELNYHSDDVRDSGDWIELYNFGNNPELLTGWYLKDGNPSNRWNMPPGTTLQPGAYLVISTDIVKFSSEFPGVSNVIGQPDFRFSNSGERITLYNAADVVVASMEYADSLPWQEGSDGHGRTLEVVDPRGDLDDPQNWFDGCMFGSPGRAYTPCDPPLVFSEINYNSPAEPNSADWLELHNRSGSSINLGNWVLKDQRDTNLFVIPAGTVLAAGDYLVLARNLAQFQSVHPSVSNVIGSFGFNFSGNGELIRLFQPSGAIAFSVIYNDDPPWPKPPDGFGPTLELLDPSGHMNRHYNWFDGCPLGSPGQAFDPWCWATAVSEAQALSVNWGLSPQGISVEWPHSQSGSLQLFDLLGREQGRTALQPGGMGRIDMSHLPAGVYLFRVNTEGRTTVLSERLYWPGVQAGFSR